MDRKKFGKLIIALRREQLDNLQKPWTREKFAKETRIDEDVLANIETGRRAILNPEMLDSIAGAFNLTSRERREFFLAASGIEAEYVYKKLNSPQTALNNMLDLLDKIQQPAFLVDSFLDIVAVNLMAFHIFGVDPKSFLAPTSDPITRFSLIRLLFSPEFEAQRAMHGKSWEDFAMNIVTLFDISTFQYRATDYFQVLHEHLYKFHEFKEFSQRKRKMLQKTYMDNNIFVHLQNAALGTMDCIGTSVIADSTAGALRLFVFTPLSKETVQIFTAIVHEGNYILQPLPNWPNKEQTTMVDLS